MYCKTISQSSLQLKPKFTLLLRQLGCVAMLLSLLVSCSAPPPKIGSVGTVESFFGVAISEEPRAALAARDTLLMGGTAADAVVTAFFVMTVTYPVAVGLGGGGVCLYYDNQSNKTETLDFRVSPAAAGGRIAVPGALRGVALLHSRYGNLPWSKLVAPAETMARFGHQISRALAKRLELQANRLRIDRTSKQIFLNTNQHPLGESETVVQVELASVLTRIRTLGVSDLYGGEVGQRLVDAAASRGGSLSISDLRKYRAVWRGTKQIPVGNHVLHYPDFKNANNLGQEAIASAIKNVTNIANPKVSGPVKFSWVVDNGQAGLVVGDSSGSAAACMFDMGTAFGGASMAPELGIFMMPATKARSDELILLGVNKHQRQTVMAVSGVGGPGGALAAASLAINVMKRGQALDGAMMKKKNRKVRIQGLWCPKGIRTTPESCQFATDSQWYGLAAFETF